MNALAGRMHPNKAIPEEADAEFAFTEADIARVKLISDLIGDLDVNNEGVSVILHLLDQVHGLRAAMTTLGQTVKSKDQT